MGKDQVSNGRAGIKPMTELIRRWIWNFFRGCAHVRWNSSWDEWRWVQGETVREPRCTKHIIVKHKAVAPRTPTSTPSRHLFNVRTVASWPKLDIYFDKWEASTPERHSSHGEPPPHVTADWRDLFMLQRSRKLQLSLCFSNRQNRMILQSICSIFFKASMLSKYISHDLLCNLLISGPHSSLIRFAYPL